MNPLTSAKLDSLAGQKGQVVLSTTAYDCVVGTIKSSNLPGKGSVFVKDPGADRGVFMDFEKAKSPPAIRNLPEGTTVTLSGNIVLRWTTKPNGKTYYDLNLGGATAQVDNGGFNGNGGGNGGFPSHDPFNSSPAQPGAAQPRAANGQAQGNALTCASIIYSKIVAALIASGVDVATPEGAIAVDAAVQRALRDGHVRALANHIISIEPAPEAQASDDDFGDSEEAPF